MDNRNRSSRYFEFGADMVPRLRSRDERAYRELLEKAFSPLAHFAYEYVRSYEIAEDIVQDTIMKILEQGESFNPTVPLPVYLYAAVRNRSLNVLEHSGVRERYARDIMNESEESDATTGESYNDIDSYLSSLTERQRSAIQLRVVEQRSMADVAKILGVSVSAVEQLVNRALKTLKSRFRTPL